MRKSFRTLTTAALMAAGIAGISTVYAQQQSGAETPASSGVQEKTMPMMTMMQQMTEMMASCNRMMQVDREAPERPASPHSEQGGPG